MREILVPILDEIAFIISVISISVVIYGAVLAFIQFIKNEAQDFRNVEKKTHDLMAIRADLGIYLLLGLELLIGADIIHTILAPQLSELLTLGGIVILRTVLSLFLGREMRELKDMQE